MNTTALELLAEQNQTVNVSMRAGIGAVVVRGLLPVLGSNKG